MKTENNIYLNGKSKLYRFFNGDFGLAKTFWLYYFTIKVIVVLFGYFLEYSLWKLPTSDIFNLMLDGIIIVVSVYFIVIIIPVLKAALKYKGNFIWSILAILSVGMTSFLTAVDLYKTFSNTEYAHYEVTETVKILNKGLPTMIDNITQLYNVSHEDNFLIFNYKIISINKGDVNLIELKDTLGYEIKGNFCSNVELQNYILQYKGLIHKYSDKNNVFMFSILLTKQICTEYLNLNDVKI